MSAVHKTKQPIDEMPRDRAARIVRDLHAGRQGEPDALLPKVEAALHDADVFQLVWPSVVLALRAEPRLDRARVAQAIARMWAQRHDDMPAQALRGLAHAAHACFDPRTAQRALDQLGPAHELPPADALLHASCRAAVGDLEAAVAVCVLVFVHEPHQATAIRLRRGWMKRITDRRPPWHAPIEDDSALMLDPLHLDHAAALAWQYRDPAIAQKTVLPAMTHPNEAVDWIHQRMSEQVVPYTLVHREHGPVGYAELMVSGLEAFLCLWIGTDWQGRGFGRALINMACRHALKAGVQIVLTAAFDHNTASLRALRGCGFLDLPVRAVEPDHDRTFLYYAARPMDAHEVGKRLVRFTTRMNTGLVFPDNAANDDPAVKEP